MNAATNDAKAPTTYTCTIGTTEVTIQRPTARKASVAFALIRDLTNNLPALQHELAKFTADYRRDNFVEYDRAQAALRFPRRALTDEQGEVVLQPVTIEGEPNPRAGEPVYVDSPVTTMSEEDWQAAGNVLRIPDDPEPMQNAIAMFPYAIEHAERPLYRLLALFTLTNDQVKTAERADGIDAALDDRVDWILDDAYADQVGELAATIGEAIDAYFVAKMRALSGRLGKLRSILTGQEPAPESNPTPTQSSNSEPTLSTPSGANSAGESTKSWTPTSESSSDYSDESLNSEMPNDAPKAAA